MLVTEITDPDWEPIMKTASAMVTERGGRTSHAAIVARELGIPAIVGANSAMAMLATATRITVSCAEGEIGKVFLGDVPFTTEEVDPAKHRPPEDADPAQRRQPRASLQAARLPSDGVGLARMEFIFASWVGVHPLALTRYASLAPGAAGGRSNHRRLRGQDALLRRPALAKGLRTIAAAFWPRPVILRFSDFKTNEYAKLVGGAGFEPAKRTRCSAGAARAGTTTQLQGGLPPRGRRGQARRAKSSASPT